MTTDTNQAAQPTRKMGCLKIGGIVVLVFIGLAIIGSILGGGGTQGSAPTKEAASTEPPVETTARELESAYGANEAAAQQKFGGRPLLVSGVINSINLGIGDEPFLVMKGNNPFNASQARLTEASQAKAASLSKGQKVKLLCQSVSEIAGTPMLNGCEIQ